MEPVLGVDPNFQIDVAENNNPSKNSELMAKIKRVAGVILAVLGALLFCAGIATFFLPFVAVAIVGQSLFMAAISLLACGMVLGSIGTYLAAKEDKDPVLNNGNIDIEVAEK